MEPPMYCTTPPSPQGLPCSLAALLRGVKGGARHSFQTLEESTAHVVAVDAEHTNAVVIAVCDGDVTVP
jgi:hypothetical protein